MKVELEILPPGLKLGLHEGRLTAAASVDVGSLRHKFKINYPQSGITKVKQQSTVVSTSMVWKLLYGKKARNLL